MTFYFRYSVLLPIKSDLTQGKNDHLEEGNHLRQQV